MRRLIIEPNGWPCTLAECEPGLFLYGDHLCFKSEYGGDAYCESGEYFWAGTHSRDDRAKLIVQPVVYRWEDTE